MKNLMIVFFCFILSSTSLTQWERTGGPEGISVNKLVSSDGNIYACTETDGLHISFDDGLSWNPLNNGMETMNIRDVITIPGYLLVATFGNGIWRSSDDGQTWFPSDNYSNIFAKAIVANESYVFAGASSTGIFRSSDNGKTWDQLFDNLDIMSMAVLGNKLFIGTYNYVYVSTDNGETWSYANGLTGSAPWDMYVTGDTMFVTGTNEIYRSTNAGVTFTTIDLGFPFSITNVYSLTSAGSNFYAATSYYGVIKSTDLGNNWDPVTNGMGPKNTTAITANGTTLVAGTYYSGLYRSTDSGENWGKSNQGLPAASTIASMVATDRDIFAGTRDGVYRSSDNGSTWLKMTGTNDTINYGTVRGICEKNGDIYAGIIYQFNSTIYKSTDRGVTWERSGNGLPSNLTFINELETSGDNLIAATDEGIYYSTDDGRNWSLSNMPTDFIEGIAASDGVAYAILQFVGLFKSVDDGVNWTYFRPATADHISIEAWNNYVFVGSFFEDAIYSSDYGSSWYDCNGFPSETAAFAFGLVKDDLFLIGTDVSSNYIYASTDGGNYFTPYSEGLGPHAVTESFAINENYIFAGTDYNGVWRMLRPDAVPVELASFTANVIDDKVKLEWLTATETNNQGFEILRRNNLRGQQSVSENSDLEGYIKIGFVEGNGTTAEQQTYSYVDNKIESGKYAYRLKQIDFDGSFEYSDIVEIDFNNIPEKFSLEQNYPNPFNPSTTIEYSIPAELNVEIKIYNQLGEEVRKINVGLLQPGTYKTVLDFSNLPSGIYIYRLNAVGSSGKFFMAKNMILLK